MNEKSSPAKLRWMLAAMLTTTATWTAFAADMSASRGRRAAPQVYARAPVPPPAYVEDPALISPPSTPILPGSSTLPGYYGRPFDYYYQGDYYGGGPYPSYFWRLPYACGVYGYC